MVNLNYSYLGVAYSHIVFSSVLLFSLLILSLIKKQIKQIFTVPSFEDYYDFFDYLNIGKSDLGITIVNTWSIGMLVFIAAFLSKYQLVAMAILSSVFICG